MMELDASDRKRVYGFIILIFIMIALFPYLMHVLDDAQVMIKNAGVFAPLLYILLMIIVVVVSPIPATPFVIIASVIFGPFKTVIYTLIGGTLGALCAFYIARYFLRTPTKKYLMKNKWYKKVQGQSQHHIAYIIFLTRLMPQVSFDIVSYLAGMTSLHAGLFAVVTFIGMIPIVAATAYFGAILEPIKNTVMALLFISFVIYTVYIFYKNKINKAGKHK